MTALVAGDGGSTGSHTVRALHEANDNVVAMDDPPAFPRIEALNWT
jgi:nucleoside-diphosphate-sugar epimerase